MQSTLSITSDGLLHPGNSVIEFRNVSFSYDESKEILHHVSLQLKPGKTYAFVGPTGGGKSTTASLIARLYDPSKGTVLLHGKNISSYSDEERTEKIGFILQEPFLFTGTVRDNILYGNEKYKDYSDEEMEAVIKATNLEGLLTIFENGLQTKVSSTGDNISLGQNRSLHLCGQ